MQIPEKHIIRQILQARFTEIELKELCDSLGDIPYSQLPGAGQRERVFELSEHHDMRLSLGKLWGAMVSLRPDLIMSTGGNLPRNVLRQYLESKLKEFSEIDLRGIAPGVHLTTKLKDIFVDLSITEPTPLQPFIAGLNTTTDILERRPRITWKNLLDHSKRHIVLGELGSGKTCLLKHILLTEAHNCLVTISKPKNSCKELRFLAEKSMPKSVLR